MMAGHVVAYFSKSSMACGSSVYWITHVIMMFPFRRAASRLGPGYLRRDRTINAAAAWEATDHARSNGGRKRAGDRGRGGRGARAGAGHLEPRRGAADGVQPVGRGAGAQ